MAPKNRRNEGNSDHITRSKSKTRDENQGAATTDSYPNATVSKEDNSLSLSRNEALPSENKNKELGKEGMDGVSPELSIVSIMEQHKVSDPKENCKVDVSSINKENVPSSKTFASNPDHANLPNLSDNREVSIQTDFPPEFQRWLSEGSPIMSMFEELKAIRVRLDKVDKIETVTSSLDRHFKDIEERTTKLEQSVQTNSKAIVEGKSEAASFRINMEGSVKSNRTKINDVSAEVISLREMVEQQGLAIAKLTTQKKDLIKSNKDVKADITKQNQEFVADMNKKSEELAGKVSKLAQQQKQQADSLHVTTQKIEEQILEKTEVRLEEKLEEKLEAKIEEKVAKDVSFQNLKDQAFENRYNIIVSGLKEEPEKTSKDLIIDLFKTLGVKKVAIMDASRLGLPRNDNAYHRPIKVRFFNIDDRNKIWRKRRNITAEEGARKVKIQADLPKELRDEMNILYRVVRAAGKTEEYKSAKIRNYAVSLNGKEYGPKDLEKLPFSIRPSTISNPTSETAAAFFSKYSKLSNHHHSPFTLQGENFQNMEHYLASKRANLSGQENLMQWAAQATDPKKAKAILHSLRDVKAAEWDQQVEEITLNGLRAKFDQNKHLLSYLKGTGQLMLGEASPNPRWGIGLDLDSPEVLDTTKWDQKGNLLGRSLMKIRDELCPAMVNNEKKSSKKKK